MTTAQTRNPLPLFVFFTIILDKSDRAMGEMENRQTFVIRPGLRLTIVICNYATGFRPRKW